MNSCCDLERRRLQYRRACGRRRLARRRSSLHEPDGRRIDRRHIASLLITFFYRQMPQMIEKGHLYLAVPPLYRLSHGGKTFYGEQAHRAEIIKSEFRTERERRSRPLQGPRRNDPAQLKETTMDPGKRTLLKVMLLADDRADTDSSVERLMAPRPSALRLHSGEGAVCDRRSCWTFRFQISVDVNHCL